MLSAYKSIFRWPARKHHVLASNSSHVHLAGGSAEGENPPLLERLLVLQFNPSSHLLPELNKCRIANYYLPWTCNLERTAWQKCQYDEYIRRMKIMDLRKEEARAAVAEE
jgi:NADH dehydrogenase (ubiquinone) 1 beta subcomplex subunit 7